MSARELADLCADLVPVPRGVQVTDLTLDSRKVSEGGCSSPAPVDVRMVSQVSRRRLRAVCGPCCGSPLPASSRQ